MRDARQLAKTAFVDSLISTLSSIRLANVFNPYVDVCDEHDDSLSPSIRKQNLLLFLSSALETEPETVWIGRDLGYRGGRRTGLPLTDEGHLLIFREVFEVPASKATRTTDVKERTAAEIWRAIQLIKQPPFLWNAFPFHPHEPGEPLNNRCHTKKEFEVCEELLQGLLDVFGFARIFVLGNEAARAMERLGKSYTYVRHPSYGGQSEFRKQMSEAYGVRLS